MRNLYARLLISTFVATTGIQSLSASQQNLQPPTTAPKKLTINFKKRKEAGGSSGESGANSGSERSASPSHDPEPDLQAPAAKRIKLGEPQDGANPHTFAQQPPLGAAVGPGPIADTMQVDPFFGGQTFSTGQAASPFAPPVHQALNVWIKPDPGALPGSLAAQGSQCTSATFIKPDPMAQGTQGDGRDAMDVDDDESQGKKAEAMAPAPDLDYTSVAFPVPDFERMTSPTFQEVERWVHQANRGDQQAQARVIERHSMGALPELLIPLIRLDSWYENFDQWVLDDLQRGDLALTVNKDLLLNNQDLQKKINARTKSQDPKQAGAAYTLLGLMAEASKDSATAKKHFKVAAEKEHTQGMYHFARVTQETNKNFKKGDIFLLYKKAALMGHADAQYRAGKMRYISSGIIKTDDKSQEDYFLMAAKQGHRDAQHSIGKDSWGLHAAEQGHAGRAYDIWRQYPKDSEQNERNFQLYLRCLQLKHEAALEAVKSNHGILAHLSDDQRKHILLLIKKYAEEGHEQSPFRLCFWYLYGIGVEKDLDKAFSYFEKIKQRQGNWYYVQDFRSDLIDALLVSGTPKHLEHAVEVLQDKYQVNGTGRTTLALDQVAKLMLNRDQLSETHKVNLDSLAKNFVGSFAKGVPQELQNLHSPSYMNQGWYIPFGLYSILHGMKYSHPKALELTENDASWLGLKKYLEGGQIHLPLEAYNLLFKDKPSFISQNIAVLRLGLSVQNAEPTFKRRILGSLADKGDVEGLRELSKLALKANLSEKVVKTAENYLLRAAVKGDAESFELLGKLYSGDYGFIENPQQALKYFQLAKDAGRRGLSLKIAKLQEKTSGSNDAHGILKIYEAAARAGQPEAILKVLLACLDLPDSVDHPLNHFEKKLRAYFFKAAHYEAMPDLEWAGPQRSCFYFGRDPAIGEFCIEHGLLSGFQGEHDKTRAFLSYYEKLMESIKPMAEAGDVQCQNYLGFYGYVRQKVLKDAQYTDASSWLVKAKEQGLWQAFATLQQYHDNHLSTFGLVAEAVDRQIQGQPMVPFLQHFIMQRLSTAKIQHEAPRYDKLVHDLGEMAGEFGLFADLNHPEARESDSMKRDRAPKVPVLHGIYQPLSDLAVEALFLLRHLEQHPGLLLNVMSINTNQACMQIQGTSRFYQYSIIKHFSNDDYDGLQMISVVEDQDGVLKRLASLVDGENPLWLKAQPAYEQALKVILDDSSYLLAKYKKNLSEYSVLNAHIPTLESNDPEKPDLLARKAKLEAKLQSLATQLNQLDQNPEPSDEQRYIQILRDLPKRIRQAVMDHQGRRNKMFLEANPWIKELPPAPPVRPVVAPSPAPARQGGQPQGDDEMQVD
ncbi:MAG: hypothetical protein ACK5O7_01190 [Holosporales bacterium]